MADKADDRAAASSPIVNVKAGDFLIREGEPATVVFILRSGEVELTRRIGDRDARLTVVGPGALVGEAAFWGATPHAASARAVGDVTAVRIEAGAFAEIARHRPDVALLTMGRLSDRCGQAIQAWAAAVDLARQAAPERRPVIDTSAPSPEPAPPGPPRLVHPDSGTEFVLDGGDEWLVGRADPRSKIQPDIDLSRVDGHRSLSRHHARLVRQSGRFMVIEEPHVANGTFVNSQRLAPGVPAPINGGDEVSFGLVRTLFRPR